MKRIIVVISSASGAIFGIRALQALKEVPLVETRLVLSPKAKSGISLMTTA